MYLQLRMEAAAALSAVNYTILICSDIIFFFSQAYFFMQKGDRDRYYRKMKVLGR